MKEFEMNDLHCTVCPLVYIILEKQKNFLEMNRKIYQLLKILVTVSPLLRRCELNFFGLFSIIK